MPDERTTRVGKYQIVELVGEGAMGSVYRALDPILNRTVAVKVMSAGIARDEDLRDRFLREAQAAGSLQHPNVITVYDFGEVDGHLFIAMEFVDGVDLEILLTRPEPVPLKTRLKLVIDVLTGLAYAHQHGIIHRDIKPANIRITPDWRAKIMDFGVAHLESSTMTRTGMMMGTPNYMAPEQLTGARVTPATDLFSVGAVLYEVLTRKRPFSAETLHQVIFKVVSEQPPPVTTLAPELPASLDQIVNKALAKDPAERYQHALAMANDLTAVLSTLGGADRSSSHSLSASLASLISPARVKKATPAPMQRPPSDDVPAVRTPAPAARPQEAARTLAALVAAGVLIGVLVGTVWMIGRRPSTTAAGGRDSARVAVAPPVAAAPHAPTPDTTAPSRGSTLDATPSSTAGANPVSPATPGRGVTAPSGSRGATELEPQVLSALRASATRARANAVAAGATVAQLAAGDSLSDAAQRALDRGSASTAVQLLNAATASWLIAERSVRASVSSASQPPASNASGASPQAAPPDTLRVREAPQPVVTTPPAPAVASLALPKAAAAPTRSAEAEIRDVIAAYAAAISARDIGLIRAAYPNMTPVQQSGFERFFATVRALDASLTVRSITVNGGTADARVDGRYDFTTTGGKRDRQPVAFGATLQRVSGVWTLATVR